MPLRTTFSVFFFLYFTGLQAQSLVSVIPLGARTKAQLASQFNLPFVQYGAKYYRITYTTTDTQGLPDTVSGLVAVPDDPAKVYPRLVYQHGTSGSKLDVPSFNVLTNGEGLAGLLFAGFGYVTLAPDYLGLGVSDGFHPYVHAASEASVALDMLRVLPAFSDLEGVNTNAQLFVTGYSQGGHASMAFHRAVETDTAAEFGITAAAHLSGPYSIGEVMRELILSDNIYLYPAYLPNTILSYQTVYGNLFDQVGEVFKDPYAARVADFYAGAISLNQLNNQLIGLLFAEEGASRPLRMLQPDIVQEVLNDPEHPFNIALRDNNVYAWAPAQPTRIFYCMADDQVPFMNSIVARDTMLARGAADLVATDVQPSADHGECVAPALTNTLLFFANYQQIGVFTSAYELAVQPLSVQPNPAVSAIMLNGLPDEGFVQVADYSGRIRLSRTVAAGDQQIDLSGLEQGLYLIRYQSSQSIKQAKIIVQR